MTCERRRVGTGRRVEVVKVCSAVAFGASIWVIDLPTNRAVAVVFVLTFTAAVEYPRYDRVLLLESTSETSAHVSFDWRQSHHSVWVDRRRSQL
jgi:hypothetical protein